MVEITLHIDERRLLQLRQRASELGSSIDALVLNAIDAFMDIPEEAFLAIVQTTLSENAELYRRLAQVTPENRHAEINSGNEIGNEIW